MMGSWTKLAVMATAIVLASSCTSGTGSETGRVKGAAATSSSPLLMPAVYGRDVSVVTTANGVKVNVYLARYGLANDKYLSQFRHENPNSPRS
jgi:hypothetical protein